MGEVTRLARLVLEREASKQPPLVTFKTCEVRCRAGFPAIGWKWVTTDCREVVQFLLACYNARRELAAIREVPR